VITSTERPRPTSAGTTRSMSRSCPSPPARRRRSGTDGQPSRREEPGVGALVRATRPSSWGCRGTNLGPGRPASPLDPRLPSLAGRTSAPPCASPCPIRSRRIAAETQTSRSCSRPTRAASEASTPIRLGRQPERDPPSCREPRPAPPRGGARPGHGSEPAGRTRRAAAGPRAPSQHVLPGELDGRQRAVDLDGPLLVAALAAP